MIVVLSYQYLGWFVLYLGLTQIVQFLLRIYSFRVYPFMITAESMGCLFQSFSFLAGTKLKFLLPQMHETVKNSVPAALVLRISAATSFCQASQHINHGFWIDQYLKRKSSIKYWALSGISFSPEFYLSKFYLFWQQSSTLK